MELTKTTNDLLLKLGFSGIDKSLSISLFEYGVLYSEELECAIFYDSTSNRIDGLTHTFISKQEIIKAAEDMPHSFFSWVGIKRKKYLQTLKYVQAIRDVNAYTGEFTASYNLNRYMSTITDILLNLSKQFPEKIKTL